MQGSSYAPLQFLRSPWNRDVYTAIDNQVDGRTTLVLYLGAASSLPSELQKYNVGCILIHKDEKQIYLNTGNDTTPTWQAFGPGVSDLPTPFVTGQYLTNDGVDAFWSLIDLATGVTGLLDSDHIDLSDLANNSDFIDYLIANSYFTSSLAGDTNFLTNLITNLNTSGTLTVVTDGVTITGDGTTGSPLTAVGGSDNYTVKATGTDTTAGYLDDKINIHSSDSSVSVTKSITNPAGNEIVDYDITVTGGGGSSGPYPGTIIVGQWDTGTAANATVESFGGYIKYFGNTYKTGAFGKATGGIGAFFNTSGANGNVVCHDYSINKAFVLSQTTLGSGNFTLTLTMYDALTAASEATWTCSGTSSFPYPTPVGLNLFVDYQSLKVFLTVGTYLGTDTIDTTTLVNDTTHVFTLSSGSGGTINGTATSFTGGAKFPLLSGAGVFLINSTTKKFITALDNNKYTYSDTLGITATNTISFGDYSGRNTVMPDGRLYKTQLYSVIGDSNGVTTSYTDFIQIYYVPTSNTILNT